MKLLEYHIAKVVLSAIALVTLMLVGLEFFILFIEQLEDLGKVNFGILQAIIYIFLQVPYAVYLFFPLSSLLGSLIGLGLLANNRELIAMQAAGVSVGQVTWAVSKAAFIVIIIIAIIGDAIVPKLIHYANEQKMRALSKGHLLTKQGIWLRSNNDFILIGTILADSSLKNVYQFHFDANHHLSTTRQIATAIYSNNAWQAFNVTETIINKVNTVTNNIAAMPWPVSINPHILFMKSNTPDEMTLVELHQYLQSEKHQHLNNWRYELVYWHRLIEPLTTIVMIMLAIPFIFGPLRSSTMNTKILTGASVGFGFHIINRFFSSMSPVLHWPVEVVAVAPTILFTLLGFYLLRKVR